MIILVDTPEAAGVPGRPFDDHTARPKHAATLGGSHDEKCGPVLYRLTGVHEFGLDENVATGRIRHAAEPDQRRVARSEEHTSELQSLMRNSYAVFCLKKNKKKKNI